jgi:hypothetical protein
MSEHKHNPESLPPHIQLLQMARGYQVARMMYVAAKLGLADYLAEEPKSAAELASSTGTHPRSLYRLMRAMAGLGVLSERADHQFALTPLGEALKTGAPGAARSGIMAAGSQFWWRAWGELPQAIETGNTGADIAWGMRVFEYLGRDPEVSSYCNEYMIALHGGEHHAIAPAYDFAQFETIVDVGGGTGNLLVAILTQYPQLHGVLFDLPQVIQDASKLIEGQEMTDRVTLEGGSFFERVPGGGDAYLLAHVIHDWPEDQCLTILENCRRAMGPGSKLLIIEMVLPEGDAPHPGKLLDIGILVNNGGEERTAEEYGALLDKAGFRMLRIVPTASPASLVEAIPA